MKTTCSNSLRLALSLVLLAVFVAPTLAQDNSSASAATDEVELNFVEELEQEISDLKKQKLSKSDRQKLTMKKRELKVAKAIVSQLTRLPLDKADKKDNEKTETDAFVLAKINVEPNSTTADICFEQSTGLLDNAQALTNYIKETPVGGFRDFRLVTRHSSPQTAEYSLIKVREAYDNYKEQERQMLEYIAQRNRALQAIQNARRC